LERDCGVVEEEGERKVDSDGEGFGSTGEKSTSKMKAYSVELGQLETEERRRVETDDGNQMSDCDQE